MRVYSFQTMFLMVALFAILNTGKAQGTSIQYTDYLPKYRTLASDFMLSKIDYAEDKMIVSFRFVANKDNDQITFYGKGLGNSWELTTATHPRYAAQAISRKPQVMNIRLNDESKDTKLTSSEKKVLSPKKGDIITCELHFEKFPRTVRTIHLKGGEVNKQGEGRFQANDILIKTADNRMLGTADQMEQSIQRFYKDQKDVNYPDIKTVTSTEEQKEFDQKLAEKKEKAKEGNALQSSLEPIDYMPKKLNNIEDLECNERIILKNVYFHEDRADYAGRVKAMRTLKIIVDYLYYQPKAKIVLHGHTDIYGNAFKNLELSKQRVMTVKRTLVKKGVDRDRVITVHHGGSQPLPKYKNGGAMNRRVEVEVLCSGVVDEIETPESLKKQSN